MKFLLSLLLCCGLVVGVLIACGSDDDPSLSHHCVDDVDRCDPNWWSCAEANMCYATLNACIASGECSG